MRGLLSGSCSCLALACGGAIAIAAEPAITPADLLQQQQGALLPIHEHTKNSWGRGEREYHRTYAGVPLATGIVVHAGGLAKAMSDPSRRWWGQSEAVLSRGSNNLPAMEWGRWKGSLEGLSTKGSGDAAEAKDGLQFQGLDMATGLVFSLFADAATAEAAAQLASEVATPAVGSEVFVIALLGDDFGQASSIVATTVVSQAVSESAGVAVEVLAASDVTGLAVTAEGKPLGYVSLISERSVLLDAEDLSTIHARAVSAWQALNADKDGAGEF